MSLAYSWDRMGMLTSGQTTTDLKLDVRSGTNRALGKPNACRDRVRVRMVSVCENGVVTQEVYL